MYFYLIDELNYGDPWIEGFCPNLLEFIKGYLLIKFEKKKVKKKKKLLIILIKGKTIFLIT